MTKEDLASCPPMPHSPRSAMTATIVVYALAVVGYVAAFAARRPATATAVRIPAARSKVLVGAGGPRSRQSLTTARPKADQANPHHC